MCRNRRSPAFRGAAAVAILFAALAARAGAQAGHDAPAKPGPGADRPAPQAPMRFADTVSGRPFSKDPAVVRFRDRYWLYYSLPPYPGKPTKGWNIGIAQSHDLLNWSKAGELKNTGEAEQNGFCAPGAIVLGGKVHLFYQSYGNAARDAICHAWSDDGLLFSRNPSNPVFGPTGDWNCGRAIDADVIEHDGRLLMYWATRDREFKVQMLGVAAAPLDSDFGRGRWAQLNPAGPILKPELPWERRCIEAPAACKHGGKLYLFYAGGYNNEPQQIGVAVSDDGIRFTRLLKEPFLPNGPPGAWNSSESGHPFFFRNGGRDLLFHQGNNDGGKTWHLSAVPIRWIDGRPAVAAAAPSPDYALKPVPFTDVTLQDSFWAPRLEANRKATVPGNLKHLEATGSLEAFAILAGKSTARYRGYMWGDSDVYKTLEGMVYTLRTHPDPALERRLEEITGWIAGAQAADGYLMPHIQLAEPKYARFTEETSRTCESYSMGHLIESAVAHYRATGRKEYLQVALRAADLLARVQAEGKLEQVSGHPEIEIALVKLFRATGDRRHLELAARYVRNAMSFGSTAWSGGRPFLGHDEPLGHAVAAVYLYGGATDVAVLTGDASLLALLERKWQNVVGRKMYLTGGIGLPAGEAFGRDYDLPNDAAYAETCAAIAAVLWNHRLFLATGDAKYLDVLERTLYNGVLAGLSLSGDRFFYPNPLQTDGRRKFNHGSAERVGWFGCPCCPANLVRFIPQAPGLFYAARGQELFVNLFAEGQGRIALGDLAATVTQRTRYPWEGKVQLVIEPERPETFVLCLRVPLWAQGRPVPGDLYRYLRKGPSAISLKVNGQPVAPQIEKGFVRLSRPWRKGDVVEIDLPMPARRVVAHEAVRADAGRVALERGPLVYCLEGADHGGRALDLALDDDAELAPEHRPDLLGGVTVLRGQGQVVRRAAKAEPVEIRAVPYYSWNHRGTGEMAVWIARVPGKTSRIGVESRPGPPFAASHVVHGLPAPAMQ